MREKKNYICETCGKVFDTPEEAEACEREHEEREAARIEKKSEENKINELVQKFYDKYGRHPVIRLKRSDSSYLDSLIGDLLEIVF